jgi:hypothetical protein
MTRVLRRDSDSSLITAKALRPVASKEEGRALLSEEGRRFPLRLSGGQIDIEILGQDPRWLYPTLHAIQHLSRLEANWDSYGAPPVAPSAIVHALNVLGTILDDDSPTPIVVPTAAGNVQLEWHQGGIDVEICCSAQGRVSAYLYNHSNHQEEELAIVGPEELERLSTVLRGILA